MVTSHEFSPIYQKRDQLLRAGESVLRFIIKQLFTQCRWTVVSEVVGTTSTSTKVNNCEESITALTHTEWLSFVSLIKALYEGLCFESPQAVAESFPYKMYFKYFCKLLFVAVSEFHQWIN